MKQVTILMHDKFKTKFMQSVDMFEDFKVALMPRIKATVVDDYCMKHVEALKIQCEGEPYGLVAVYDEKKLYYRDPKVKVLSDGNNFVILDDLVSHLEPMEVKDA